MTEARMFFENMRTAALRRAEDALLAAGDMRVYAAREDIGHATRGISLSFATEHDATADYYLRRADACATILEALPTETQ